MPLGVILALMPLGVEHSSKPARPRGRRLVILALMPLGVEHDSRCVRLAQGVSR